MSTQATGYITVADFVEMVRKKFNSEKNDEVKTKKVEETSNTESQQAFSQKNRPAQQNEQNERYGVDIIV